ncbi:MAG: Gfo/Idh/MocA family oxidoreductase [Woeseiaceae bacterium]|nr:Gfo/Idh/MocA family oxidoreductase [Woeseiaceae bacterium]
MSGLLRVGLVGCGVITQRTAAGIAAIVSERAAAITALCDLNSSNLDTVAGKLANTEQISRFTDLDTLLSAECCDALILATPIGMHFAQVERALQRGVHVYTHKTLARTRAECEQLDALARQADLRLAASPGQVLLPAYERAVELIANGVLGRIVSVDASAEAAPHRFEAERQDEAPREGDPYSWEWYHLKDAGGGPLDDMFVYPLAFLTEAFGELDEASVYGELVTPRIEWRGRVVEATAFDSYTGVGRIAGTPVTMRSSFSSNTQHDRWGTIVIRGTRAALEIVKYNDLDYSLYITPNSGPATAEEHPVFRGEQVQRYGDRECHVLVDIREFIDAVQEHRHVRGATAANAARTASALRMIEDSAARSGIRTTRQAGAN